MACFGHLSPAELACLQALAEVGSSDEQGLCKASAYPAGETRGAIPTLEREGALRRLDGGRLEISEEGRAVLAQVVSLGFEPGAPAGPGEVEYYSQGSCHVFAMAARDVLRGKGYRVFFDPFEVSCEAEDPDDEVLAVVHVYAVVEIGGGDWAVDVFGMRPLEAAEREVVQRYSAGIVCHEDYETDSELQGLISQGLDDNRDPFLPLHEVKDADLEEARRDVVRIFPAQAAARLPGPEF